VYTAVAYRTAANALGWDLAHAWERLTRDTRAAFPSPAQRRAPDDPAYWLTDTTAALMHELRAPGYAERREYDDASLAFECDTPYRAQPCIDEGDMHCGHTDFLVATALRFCLDMPA
jgi:hypothetical protein